MTHIHNVIACAVKPHYCRSVPVCVRRTGRPLVESVPCNPSRERKRDGKRPQDAPLTDALLRVLFPASAPGTRTGINRLCRVVLVLVAMFAARSAAEDAPQVVSAITAINVLEPAQGHPRFVKPEGSFPLVFELPQAELSRLDIVLRHSRNPSMEIPAVSTVAPTLLQDRYWVMLLKVPGAAAEGVYDVILRSGTKTWVVPRSLCVRNELGDNWRFVHLSNMNIGDPSAPAFSDAVVQEVNLLAPDFIIATGDFVEPDPQHSDTNNSMHAWQRAMAYLARFDAPVYVTCGEIDDIGGLAANARTNLIGYNRLGSICLVLLTDSYTNPIEQDPEQVKAMLRIFEDHPFAKLVIIASNKDDLAVLDAIRSGGRQLDDVFNQNRHFLLLAGGATDWDGREYADRLTGLDAVTYVRTGQSSSAIRDGADGTPRYRLLEYRNDALSTGLADDEHQATPSVPSGRLHVYYDGANDGTADRVIATVVNGHTTALDNCRVVCRLAGRVSPDECVVIGGHLEQILPADTMSVVTVRVDVPDRAGVDCLVAANAQAAGVPVNPHCTVSITCPERLTFNRAVASTGLHYYSSVDGIVVALTNTSDESVQPLAQVRLNGSILPLQVDGGADPSAPLTAGESISYRCVPVLAQLDAGVHHLVVYCYAGDMHRVTTQPVILDEGTSATAPSSP